MSEMKNLLENYNEAVHVVDFAEELIVSNVKQYCHKIEEILNDNPHLCFRRKYQLSRYEDKEKFNCVNASSYQDSIINIHNIYDIDEKSYKIRFSYETFEDAVWCKLKIPYDKNSWDDQILNELIGEQPISIFTKK